jgi:K+-sensing histidine kinase KdpD
MRNRELVLRRLKINTCNALGKRQWPGYCNPDQQQKIFNMFYRASEDSSGSGLGLYIVREIVARLSGTIQLKSALGQGSTFTLWLPNHL